MKKKAKKQAKKTSKTPTLMDKLPKDRGEWLELVIKLTLRGIGDSPKSSSDQTMLAQAERLKKELIEWRKNEGKN